MAVKSYRELIVWQKAMDFAEAIYQKTADFPEDERYGLTQQLRRAGVSVPSNIAEGQGRRTTADFLKFLWIANGSTCESETQILLSERLGYIGSDNVQSLLNLSAEIGRLNSGLRRSLTTDH